ncbi:MAG: hypothetical protein NVV74_19365 [Magnetospirillum sp.]|nr:hypothetical protein [Magnetospirillum sp.]
MNEVISSKLAPERGEGVGAPAHQLGQQPVLGLHGQTLGLVVAVAVQRREHLLVQLVLGRRNVGAGGGGDTGDQRGSDKQGGS